MIEKRIILNEGIFTRICKMGFFDYQSQYGKSDVHLTKLEIKDLCEGKEVIKLVDGESVKLLPNVSSDISIEIVKRSPLFSDLYVK